MKVITRRDVIEEARREWLMRNSQRPVDAFFADRTFGQVRAALNALDPEAATIADFDAAIGVSNWARNSCDECGKEKEILIHLGDEPDHDAQWQRLCANCLCEAVGLAVRASR